MPVDWPGFSLTGGNLLEPEKRWATKSINELHDRILFFLAIKGINKFDSFLLQPWNLFVKYGKDSVWVAFAELRVGSPTLFWEDARDIPLDRELFLNELKFSYNWTVQELFRLPLPGDFQGDAKIEGLAYEYVQRLEKKNRLSSLGDISKVPHLSGHLEAFLGDHPNPDKNVFVMMRFIQSEQLDEVYKAIKTSLASFGFNAVRADGRDYTTELWSNIEVYIYGCKYGIAVLEDFTKEREFNPNVSLELGYMMGLRKRVLILKEETLPQLHADVAHRLYKPFDKFKITSTINREIDNWIKNDLAL